MTLEHEDTTTVVTGTVVIDVVLKSDGEFGTSYGLDGLSKEAALGHLLAVSDRIRKEIEFSWDTCAECGRPWEAHIDPDEDEDEEDDDELQS